MSANATPGLPSWVVPLSRAIIAMQRFGIAFFSFHVISIPGRRTGLMRTTVVSPFTFRGHRYLLSLGDLDWVRNARAAGWGILSRGRQQARVALIEIPPPESASIVGEFPRQIPGGVQFFLRTGLVQPPGSPAQFAAGADRMARFRIDPEEELLEPIRAPRSARGC